MVDCKRKKYHKIVYNIFKTMSFENYILDICELLLKKTGYSDHQICYRLRAFHFIFPNIAAFFIFFGSKKAFKIVIIVNAIIMSCFIMLNGCILSRLERRFTDEDYTILDPVMDLLGIEKTNENRIQYSIYSGMICFIGTGFIYYLRFIYTWGNASHENIVNAVDQTKK